MIVVPPSIDSTIASHFNHSVVTLSVCRWPRKSSPRNVSALSTRRIKIEVRPFRSQVAFDMFTGEFTHQGKLCTFEVLARAIRPRSALAHTPR
jgi:hypothetical protein